MKCYISYDIYTITLISIIHIYPYIERLTLLDQVDTLKNSQKVAETRISFLVNRTQNDEDARSLYNDERKKLEAQIMKLTNLNDEYSHRIQEHIEIQRNHQISLKTKSDEYNSLLLKYEDAVKDLHQRDMDESTLIAHECSSLDTSALALSSSAKPGAPDDIENVRLNEGK